MTFEEVERLNEHNDECETKTDSKFKSFKHCVDYKANKLNRFEEYFTYFFLNHKIGNLITNIFQCCEMRTWQDPWYINKDINKSMSTKKSEVVGFYKSLVSFIKFNFQKQ